jgi:hypothetical protein
VLYTLILRLEVGVRGQSPNPTLSELVVAILVLDVCTGAQVSLRCYRCGITCCFAPNMLLGAMQILLRCVDREWTRQDIYVDLDSPIPKIAPPS